MVKPDWMGHAPEGPYPLNLQKVFVLVTWDRQTDHMGRELVLPNVRHYEDEQEAIEILKDALPLHDRAHLFYCDETGGWGRVPGWN